MKKIYLSLIILFTLGSANAQVPTLYYDFENNATRTTYENAVEQAINAGSGALTPVGIGTVVGLTGAGAFNGGAATGTAISAQAWQNTAINPGTAAANYFQFVVNTTGFETIQISFDNFASDRGPARVGVLYNNGGGLAAATTAPVVTGNVAWSSASTFLLPAAANNQPSVTIRIYGYEGSTADRTGRLAFNNNGVLRLDNLTVSASTVTAAKTLLNYPAIGLSIRSGTAFLPTYTNLTVDAATTLASDIAFSGTLHLKSGLFNLSTFNANISALALIQRSEGSISATPNYAGYTNFLYTNTTLITSHPELPATLNVVRDLTMNGAGGITLANPVSLYGTLTLTNGIINTINTNFLYLGRNDLGSGLLGAVSGGNGSSYVFGPVQRDYENNLMTTNKIYPVGTQGRYRPIMINISHNNVAPTVYRVTIVEPNDLWDAGNTGSVKTVSQQRRYTLDRIDVGASAINNREVTLWWNDDDNVIDYTTLAMGRYDLGVGSNKWAKMGSPATFPPGTPNPPGPTALGYVYGELNPNDIFYYALVSESFDNTLPVSLFSFSGKKDNNANILSWSTASESNSRGFEIQRSSDGINYTSIGFVNSVAASGFSSTVLNYSYADYTANAAKSYYRLRFVDLDNRSKFSNILVIKGEKPVTLTIDGLFPNPASAQINMLIATPDKDRVTILLSDMAGRTLLQKVVSVETGSNSIPLDISKLTNGTYIVRLICEKGCEKAITTFVKQ